VDRTLIQEILEVVEQAAIASAELTGLGKKDEALASRRGSLGEAEYQAKYEGLDHLFYDRGWMLRALTEIGAKVVQIEDQRIDGYTNASFRFNVYARL